PRLRRDAHDPRPRNLQLRPPARRGEQGLAALRPAPGPHPLEQAAAQGAHDAQEEGV
ncbi:aldehyde reductase II, partial [Colletotrichum sp. SAR11_240]